MKLSKGSLRQHNQKNDQVQVHIRQMIIAQVERPNVDCRARQVPSVSLMTSNKLLKLFDDDHGLETLTRQNPNHVKHILLQHS